MVDKEKLLETIKRIENSPEAKDMRERLLDIAKRIGEVEEGAKMDELVDDTERTRRVIQKNRSLNALYGLHIKTLLEEVEFKRTGKHIVID